MNIRREEQTVPFVNRSTSAHTVERNIIVTNAEARVYANIERNITCVGSAAVYLFVYIRNRDLAVESAAHIYFVNIAYVGTPAGSVVRIMSANMDSEDANVASVLPNINLCVGDIALPLEDRVF